MELLQRAFKVAPGHAKEQEDLGTVLLTLNRPEEAVIHLERARELSPAHPPLLSKLSAAKQKLGMDADADALRREAAAQSPAHAKLDEATKLFVQGKFRESEKLAQQLVRENPHDVNAALLLARLAMMANCYEDARAILEKIIAREPSFIAAWHDLGTVKIITMRKQWVLNDALSLQPENALTHFGRAGNGARPADAVEAYQRAVELDPELPEHMGLVTC